MTATQDEIVEQVLNRRGRRRDQLVQILREVQAHTHWLPRELLARIGAGVGLSAAVVEGVAGFYRFFHLRPVGRYHLLFSDNVIERQAGSRVLARDLCRRLWIEPGKVSEDGLVSVGFCSDIGLGDQGPALLVNQHQVLTRLDSQRIYEIADLVRAQVPPAQWPADWQRIDDQVRRADVLLAAPPAQGEAIRAALARGADATLQELRQSGLRGRGGAGFDTALKWTLCRQAPVPEGGTRVVVCNADEGEPGTFKDRVLLRRHFDAVLEGMTVGAFVLGARQGFVYLRGEYRWMLESLEAVLAARRAAGLLGLRIAGQAGFDFDVAIHLGAGAYVCGEESSLIESLEGKRGTPRIRPPFPVESGYLGQPTVVNNVETWCAAAQIAQRGGAWWAALGVPGSSGTKIHSVSGDCERPGLYEYPFGVSVEQILADCGASEVQAVQVGGPSGQTLAAHEFGRRIAFDDVPTAGAFMVFDARRDLFEVARGFAQFFAHESCGFCTPCRVGTELIVRRMDKLAEGHGSLFDEAELRDLDRLLHGSTHCGLGATAANPLRHTIDRFRPAYLRRLQSPDFVPGFDPDAELASARRVTRRHDPGDELAHAPRIAP
ncbi:MAG: NAD(P)H-dependent oxidoreductase subunit E [Piscinibacter sp.]|uniref:NAD(P)H-dependent oxidoreductase subunit E n=1 Tax=Piscinibacter TaxID=1114981 RepID=UPI000FDEE834|nr:MULTISPECIES: NAD(P)H-dependent oxidoreductase subunit E [Piscinibacter]MCW5667955.1 NAD(P)H-dependent oxidoreductase subunit E [Piscinibacter sp.]